MNPDIVEQVLRDYEALRHPDMDAELEAVRAAILVEDVFGVTLPDGDINPAVFADPSAVAALITRFRGTA